MPQDLGTTFGSGRLYRLLISLLRRVSPRVVSAFMAVAVVPVTMVFSRGTRITRRYYRHRRGYGPLGALWATYRNHCLFGQTVVDKFAMYAGRQVRIVYNGLDHYERLLAAEAPFVQLSAHIGCSELVGYTLRVSKPCNVLVYGGENAALMDYRRALFRSRNVSMIPVGTDRSYSADIAAALDRGEIVSVFADRFPNRDKVVPTTLHGYPVSLARGPFSLAVTRGLEVVMLSAMKEADGSYSAYFTPLRYDATASPREQRRQLARAYTAEVERLLDAYPLQWFNYFDLWQPSAAAPSPATVTTNK